MPCGVLGGYRDKGKLWRKASLRTHVISHIHFYTTLLILFLRYHRI